MIKILAFFLFINCSHQQNVKSITISQLVDLLKKEKIQLIDIRTPEEVKEGKIANAININFFDVDFIKKIENQVDKSKPVYIYCKSGSRSLRAYHQLKSKNFDVYHLEGGYLQWKFKK